MTRWVQLTGTRQKFVSKAQPCVTFWLACFNRKQPTTRLLYTLQEDIRGSRFGTKSYN